MCKCVRVCVSVVHVCVGGIYGYGRWGNECVQPDKTKPQKSFTEKMQQALVKLCSTDGRKQ